MSLNATRRRILRTAWTLLLLWYPGAIWTVLSSPDLSKHYNLKQRTNKIQGSPVTWIGN